MKKSVLMNSVATLTLFAAFDPGEGGKWKLDENGAIVMKDGDPVYTNSAGEESTIAGNVIKRLNDEAFVARKAKEDVDKKLKKFGDLDPQLARKAIDTVSKIDAKTLIDAGDVDKVRAEISSGFEAQVGELKTQNETLQATVESMTLDGAFNGSQYVKDKIAVPTEMFRSTFGRYFKVEDGKVVPYGADGNRLMSKASPGAYADFDEGVAILVEGYQYKDSIMKPPSEGNGSGSGGGGGGRGQGATISTAEFDQLPPNKQAEMAAKAGSGELTIVD